MIQIECDNCERTFEVPDDTAGTKLPCPMCGDVNRVPGASAAAVPAADGTGPKTDDGKPLPPVGGPERDICVVRPGMFRAHPFRYLFIVVLGLAALVGSIASLVSGAMSWAAIPLGLLFVAMGIWFAWWWMSTHWWMKLVITNKRTVRYEGLIKRHTTEVLHDHVRSVDINQSAANRILGVGSIGIDSAGQDGVEIEIDDIPRPYEVKKIIDQYRRM